ncbi:hypothetical protein B0H13DRAFT_2185293 [Mycena leptocephala]|nr:hypothetical protein B0H13DRAFT_2185293 [Mycena leptocephala]
MLVLFSFLAIFSWFFSAQAIPVNVTIDDTKGDSLTGALVVYAPLNAWNDRANCNNSCPIQPDETMLNDQTWHGSTFSANSKPHANVPLIASVSFNGSAVYVFCALDGNIDATFYLDGVQVGTLLRTAVEPAGYEYNVPVYANPSIPQGQHTLVMQNGRPNGIQSLMILDSIVYTYDNDPSAASQVDGPVASSSSSSSSTKHGPSGRPSPS